MMEELLARQQQQAANAQALPLLPVPQNQPIGGSRSPAHSPRGQQTQINLHSNTGQGLPQIDRMIIPGQQINQPGLYDESFDGGDLGQGRPQVNPMLAGILNKNTKYRDSGNAMDGMPKFGSKPAKGLLGTLIFQKIKKNKIRILMKSRRLRARRKDRKSQYRPQRVTCDRSSILTIASRRWMKA
jgi:hypothetical protein